MLFCEIRLEHYHFPPYEAGEVTNSEAGLELYTTFGTKQNKGRAIELGGV